GQHKARSAQTSLAALNPQVQVRAIDQAADEALLNHWVPQAQVVLDCTDHFSVRQLINRVCWTHGVPLVSASAVRYDGQISVFDPRVPNAPCYACLFPPETPPEETRCALMGVFAPVVGMMGVMQAGEALKLLAGLHAGNADHVSLAGRLLLLDGRDWSWTTLQAHRRADCPVCASDSFHRIST